MMIAPKEYIQFAGTVSNSFGKEWDKVQDQFDTSYQFLHNIPDSAWLPLSQLCVSQWEKWPPNIIKAIRDVYGNWARGANFSGEAHIVYNRDDDIRFPISLMQRAFRILDEQGFGPYQAYANAVHMPRTDRDRIENKHRVCKAHEVTTPQLPEIGHRVNTWKPRPAIMPLREPGE